MLVSSAINAELIRETADRLQDGGSFMAYQDMDGSAQADVKRGLAELKSGDRHLIGDPDPNVMQLARGILFFSCDPGTDTLYNTPWIRSPRTSHRYSHSELIGEFDASTQARYPNIDVLNTLPSGVSGIIARVPDQTPIFFGSGGLMPEQHTAAMEEAQKSLAQAGSLLHIQLGSTLLLAESMSSLPRPQVA